MQPSLAFGEAFRIGITKMFVFDGRARRSEYWWYYLAIVLFELSVAILLALIVSIMGYDKLPESMKTVLEIIFWIPLIGISVRRLHDIGRSGLWLLLALTGIGSIVLLVFFCMDSKEEANEYGPSPKYGLD